MKHYKVARRYASALMASAEQMKTLDKVAADLGVVSGVVDTSREFRMLLASPVISAEKKTSVMKEIFEKHVSTTTMQFISLMVSKKREEVLPEMIQQFRSLHDQKMGIASVEVTSAVDLSGAQEKSLQAQLERYTGKKIRVKRTVDEKIMGGLVVRIGDTLLDASIKRQLELLRECFLHGDSAVS